MPSANPQNFFSADTRRHRRKRIRMVFPSEIVRASLFTESIHHLTHKRKFLHQPTQHSPKMRMFYEHFCRNDRRSILLHIPKPRACLCERVFSSRSGLPRAFFLLFASIFLLSFPKEGRKTRNLKQKESLIIKISLLLK